MRTLRQRISNKTVLHSTRPGQILLEHVPLPVNENWQSRSLRHVWEGGIPKTALTSSSKDKKLFLR
ncbi:hypothetical protein A3H16_01155 [Candidatus Kaiserbacteria bacterium RIFCSPLOWO2_12_FULL_53_8]|uniref:Uncharacterized protein n=2 Tax=Candidatus Kaiseribacteriota TaxID=1752734 RepID=A0A1F6CT80_9BACT|nr:MAG: hypothetical protein A2851_04905 [Candidatus Kaiserbacteria bacterium RIFCSPHIGHO2_01_FULL_53_29]OGG90888.1 MAG: hypothetical protein A3H16_01155 [Candidatus Kaiserbacteria bacterium RIFCSPLOWO2_12_FULL_53_8]